MPSAACTQLALSSRFYMSTSICIDYLSFNLRANGTCLLANSNSTSTRPRSVARSLAALATHEPTLKSAGAPVPSTLTSTQSAHPHDCALMVAHAVASIFGCCSPLAAARGRAAPAARGVLSEP